MPSQERVNLPSAIKWSLTSFGQIDGHGKTDAGVHPFNHGVDGNDFAIKIDQRAAAVAGIDAGVGLDEILVRVTLGFPLEGTSLGADMAKSDAVTQGKRRADGQHKFPHSRAVGIAQLGRRQARGLDLNHGNVRFRVGALDFPVEGSSVLEPHRILSAFSTT